MSRQAIARALMVLGALSLLGALASALYGVVLVRKGFSARDEPSALETWAARALRRAPVPSRAVQLKNPLPSTPEVLAEARAHWADHCALCHANNGSGDTQLGRNMFPRAPDMRRPSTQDMSDGELYSVIQNGIRLTGMPAWGEPVEDDLQTWGLVAFIRHLPELTEEEAGMKELNPKSSHEQREQQLEEEFLNAPD
ncbi:MAG: c-type cytochrome [Myxococcaceae bacterium]|nr:c-type cytochrome [Myxococcaceae bacterium]MCI0672370.1 c-type cytochrome [Myxococcaceae bacterium]